MNRRAFLKRVSCKALAAAAFLPGQPWIARGQALSSLIDPELAKVWLERWRKAILDEARSRYCDKEMGEEIGWLISPILDGFHYGWLATRDPVWVEMLIDWTDSWARRAVAEPDGFTGWPKPGGASTDTENYNSFNTDSLLGEAMALRPVTLAAAEILKTPALKSKYQDKAEGYIRLSERTFEKWDQRGSWRESGDDGAISVVLPFGMDAVTGKWTGGYARRTDSTFGISHPNNKANEVALWLVALHDATGKAVYKTRAAQWFRVMKSRMTPREDGKYLVWNYWNPAGPWDYNASRSPKHWVGVHPNGGYYLIDTTAIVCAFEHGLVFNRQDIDRLIATNRDFMWNRKMEGASFKRIDGGAADSRWKNTPGVLWTALAPYDETLRRVFLANHDPGGWGGLSATPWFLWLARK